MTKNLVLPSLLCLVVLAAAFGVIQALGRIATDLHRSAVALGALVVRIGAVEQDLAAMSDDVFSIAEDVGIIAESLMVEEEGFSEGEPVRAPQLRAPRDRRVVDRARAAARYAAASARGVRPVRHAAAPRAERSLARVATAAAR